MGILDEAIREHLELKRAHGAGDSELKQLEDEAFGQADRPGDEEPAHDPAAEAPTEFMTQPETAEAPESRREPTIADLQEPPPLPAEEQSEPVDEAPAEEEHPAMEHEVVTDVPESAEPEADAEPEPVEPDLAPSGPSTEERHAIAEQPTEIFDVQEELNGPPSPTDEELVEEEVAEPRLAPTDPFAGFDEDENAEVSVQGPAPDDDDGLDDEDDAFWNEQRLSDELDQALEAPRDPEPAPADEPEAELVEEPEEESEPEEEPDPAAPQPPRRDDDVLEETPDFLEEAPEDDQLWFEQKPPKDFDFDD